MMFTHAAKTLAFTASAARLSARQFGSSSALNSKVAVLGASGGIGQPLSLLCKLSPYVSQLSCYDVVGTAGVAADLSHIPTRASVTGSVPSPPSWPPSGNTGLADCLSGADVVVIPAGVPRKPGMTRDDLFNTNAGIVRTLMEGVAKHCPNAVVAIISNPVNSTVPIACEVMKKAGVFDPKKICGVTTLDVCRANTFIADVMKTDPANVNVSVIGGHAGITILPLFSQVNGLEMDDATREKLTVRVQFGGDEVVQAKAGAGSATLSMAYAGFVFTENVLRGLSGESVVMNSYVQSSVIPGLDYFSSPCKFGPNGVEEVMGIGEISEYENGWLEKMKPDLSKQIQKGIDFTK
jgi:malate dehydrogenase